MMCTEPGSYMSHRSPLARRNLLRPGAATLIPQMLEEQGISLEAIFGRTGFSRRSPAQPEPVVPLIRLGRIFKAAATATAQAEFGLLVGLRAGSRLIDWGQGPMPSDTDVSTALMRIISRPASFPNSLLNLSISGNACTIGCEMLPNNLIARDQLTDCALGFAASTLRVLCGQRWRATAFRFAHRPPPDPSRHAALLQAPISFDANATAMEFETMWLDRGHISRQVSASDDRLEQRLPRDIVGEVREALASWNSVDKPSAPAVAWALGLQPRTLNRLLGRTGTRFSQMLEETRYERARSMLQDHGAPIVSIAWSLGYTDASAFSRAFRQWSGVTPTEWRKAAASSGL
jgi:AraC-like DNA-binding protein